MCHKMLVSITRQPRKPISLRIFQLAAVHCIAYMYGEESPYPLHAGKIEVTATTFSLLCDRTVAVLPPETPISIVTQES